jgi:hypothetical protein
VREPTEKDTEISNVFFIRVDYQIFGNATLSLDKQPGAVEELIGGKQGRWRLAENHRGSTEDDVKNGSTWLAVRLANRGGDNSITFKVWAVYNDTKYGTPALGNDHTYERRIKIRFKGGTTTVNEVQ